MSEYVRARSFTFFTDAEGRLIQSVVLPDKHLFIIVSDCQGALALAQLAEHNAEVARKLIYEVPAGHD